MAQKIIWSPRAADDLEDICKYIERDSQRYSAVFAQRVFSAVELLAEFPETGRIVPEYDDFCLRERILGNYRIVYRMSENTVGIAAISHGSRLLHL